LVLDATVEKKLVDVAFPSVVLPETVSVEPSAVAPVAVNAPLTVDEAWDTNPLVNVARPVKVDGPATANDCAAKVPSVAFCAKRFVDDATVAKKFVDVAFTSVVLLLTFNVCATNVPRVAFCAKRLVLDAIDAKNAVDVAFARVVLPATLSVEPSTVAPVAVNAPFTVELAVERKPPKVERPDTESVEPSAVGPVALKAPTTVDDACDTYPFANVPSPPKADVPETAKICAVRLPRSAFCANKFVVDATDAKKFVEVAFANVVPPETVSNARELAPVTVRSPFTVDDACDIKPVPNVVRPVFVMPPATVSSPNCACEAKRYVDDATVAKKLVEVALSRFTPPTACKMPPTSNPPANVDVDEFVTERLERVVVPAAKDPVLLNPPTVNVPPISTLFAKYAEPVVVEFPPTTISPSVVEPLMVTFERVVDAALNVPPTCISPSTSKEPVMIWRAIMSSAWVVPCSVTSVRLFITPGT
jgi:hypothetical protein